MALCFFIIKFQRPANILKSFVMSNSNSVNSRRKRLLNTGNGADVHFLVGEGDEKQLLPAHKALLGTASNVFETMFRYDAQNAKSTAAGAAPSEVTEEPIEVPDVEVSAFKAMLAYIYADDLRGLNGENAIAVLYAANKYDVSGLIEACVNFTIGKLSNVFDALVQARFLGKEDFAHRCLGYIDVNAATLILSKAFLQIDQKLLCEILDRDELMISEEIAIWNAARNACEKAALQKAKWQAKEEEKEAKKEERKREREEKERLKEEKKRVKKEKEREKEREKEEKKREKELEKEAKKKKENRGLINAAHKSFIALPNGKALA